MTETCVYSFDPGEADSSSIDLKWECPHETYIDTDYCIFHLPPETRDKLGVTEVDLREEFLEKASSEDGSQRAFVGAVFGDFEIDLQEVGGGSDAPVDLRHVEVDGHLDMTGSTFDADLLLDDSSFQKLDAADADLRDVSVERCTFTNDVNFDGARIDEASFSRSKFEASAVYSDADFQGHADFTRASFDGPKTVFKSTEFHGGVDFERARFGELGFSAAHVDGLASYLSDYPNA
ncbi:MAG: pentapeptide repeat-containing protein, partial [Halobacteriota archaeon]